MAPVGFEPTISAGERPKTYALDRAATRTGFIMYAYINWIHVSVTWRDATKFTRYSTATFVCRLQLCIMSESSDNKLYDRHNTQRTIDIQIRLLSH